MFVNLYRLEISLISVTRRNRPAHIYPLKPMVAGLGQQIISGVHNSRIHFAGSARTIARDCKIGGKADHKARSEQQKGNISIQVDRRAMHRRYGSDVGNSVTKFSIFCSSLGPRCRFKCI